jgi:Mannosyltransferase putative
LENLDGVSVFNLANISKLNFHAGEDDHKLYQVKAGALLYSKLEKILFLDSDNTPVKDPTFLFSSPPLVETGALFWKDLWKTTPVNPIYKILEIPCVDEYDQESGQIVVDKSFPGVTKALKLSLYMQENSDIYYKLLLGDKDTFRLSWRLLSLPFHMIRPHLGTLGGKLNGKSFCGIAMAQYAPYWAKESYGPYPPGYSEPAEPELLFVHANLLKYTELGRARVIDLRLT